MAKRKALMYTVTLLGLLMTVALVSSPALGASNQPLTIKTMRVSVEPEYDDPRIMVTYQGEFAEGSVFPQDVLFAMPMGSEINMVCALKPPNDEHLCQLYKAQPAADDLSVSYTLPIPTYYLEYYYDGVKGLPDKSFTFKYVAPYAITSLDLEVQQPLKATDFTLDQPYASATTDGQGFKHYRYNYTNVAQGQVITLGATYTKPDNKPSVAKQQAGSGTAKTTGSSNSNSYLLVGMGLVVLVVVGFFLLRRNPAPAHARVAYSSSPAITPRRERRAEARLIQAQRAQMQTAPRPAASRPVQTVTAPPSAQQAAAAFCTQCGAKLASGSAFCHACGAKARTA